MNLAKRASLVILPVVISSYLLVACFMYEREEAAILNLEQSKLEQHADHLKSAYASYRGFIIAYLSTLIEGEILAGYLSDSSNVYREKMLTAHLKSAVNRFEGDGQLFASLTLFNADDEVYLYLENSIDPFATMPAAQQTLIKNMGQSKQLERWEHVTKNAQSLLQYAIALDPRTLAMPVLISQDSITRLLIAVKPKRYDELLQTIKGDYDAVVSYGPNKILREASSKLFAQVKLASNNYLSIEPDGKYLSSQLKSLKTRLLIFTLLSILFTFTLLQWLIRKFITGPIIDLDNQLTDIKEKRISSIKISSADNEVSSLGRKFHELYEALNGAFKESYEKARIDSLTQLPNRLSFHEDAEKLLAFSKKTSSTLSLVYIDVDDFKFVNDKYGHETGDELLQAIAIEFNYLVSKSMPKCIPSVAYRLSGDEFVILLSGHSRDSVKNISNQVLESFTKGFEVGGRLFVISASIGVACYPSDGNSITQLVSNADLAMYQAKKTGKNLVAIYSDELAENERKVKELEALLKSVNPKEEFSLHYMPIVDQAGSIKSCEALLRWCSPKLGQIPPDLFIPIAEEIGVYEMIDCWVVEQAFKDYIDLRQLSAIDFNISINISSAQLNSERFLLQLELLCNQYAISTNNFTIEITETFAMKQSHEVISWLESIRRLGFKIAIDDFGTGYTSIMQMVNYPVDMIKFDKQLIERITQSDRVHLAGALINLCHIQGIEVVAEGIETSLQSECLKQANCDYQQGYLIAKPMSYSQLNKWLVSYANKKDKELLTF
jgi:diguanylate cyclase (GGDEF)-like protein